MLRKPGMRMMDGIRGLPSALFTYAQQTLDRGQRQSYRSVAQELDGEPVAKGQRHHDSKYYSTTPSWLQRTSRRTLALLSAASVIACVLLAAALFSPRITHHQPNGLEHAQYLYVLIPASRTDAGLCKTILTAEILGYPPPRILPIDESLDQPSRASDRHEAKIKVVKDYLDSQAQHHGNSMVILLDGASSYFQLRPEVLMTRYYRLIEEANHRLERTLGREVVAKEKLNQTVLFPAQGSCFDRKDPSCYSAPKVPSGHLTDKDNRWLNNGITIGPVKDLHLIYERAKGKVDRMKKGVNEHALLSEIYGEQELQRAAIREYHMSRWETAVDAFGKQLGLWSSPTSPQAGRGAVGYREGQPDEFSIALDYDNVLGLSLDSAAGSITPRKHAKSHKLASEISASRPPFWTVSGYGLPINDTWSDVNLLVNDQTGVTPAVIALNGKDSSAFDSRWWKELWMQPHARKLYDSVAVMPNMPAARVLDANGTEHVFWWTKQTMDRAGVLDHEDRWASWENLCNSDDFVKDIFADGKGSWKNPAP